MPSSLVTIVMAAGQGTRMKSRLPKVLHPLAGRAMVSYPVQAALDAGADRVVVVVGTGRELVEAELGRRFDTRVTTAIQRGQRGTGDAARCGLQALDETFDGWVVILNGDIPLVTSEAIRALLDAATKGSGPLALLTCHADDPTGYGRILRDDSGRVVSIREHRDCDPAERAIQEMNPGVYAVRADFFRTCLPQLDTRNAQGELYLTDLVALAADAGGVAARSWPIDTLHGINDRWELSERERMLRLRIAQDHAKRGVTIRDPLTTFIDADVSIEPDAHIESQVHLRGRCRIGTGARIDVGCVLQNVEVGENAVIKPYTVARDSTIGSAAQLGPFSHLRPQAELGPEVHVGNFVEIKKTRMGRGSKANHLAYLGDGVIGERVNVGAGTIFCNYDGFNKHVTVLEDEVFIGSDSQLVAPVTVGRGAYVATGTTVSQDVPAEALAIGRTRQQNKPGMATRIKNKFRALKEAGGRRQGGH